MPNTEEVRRNRMSKLSERRLDERVQRIERLFMRVIDESRQPPQLGAVMHCISEDLSANGMRVQVADPVALGTKVQVWIKFYGIKGTFMLEGEVRWVRDDGGPARWIGVEFTKGDRALDQLWRGWDEIVAEIA